MVSIEQTQGELDNTVETEEPENNSALADIMAAVEASEKAAAGGGSDETVEAAQPAEEHATKATAEAGQEPTDKGTSEKPHDPLATWKQADKERFKELPPAMQDFVLRREKERNAEFDRKSAEISEFKREYGAVDELFKPYKPQMQASGLTPYGVIQAWRNVEQALMDGRGEQVIRDIAKNYNIDLAKITGAAPAQTGELTDEQRAQKELEAILKPALTPYEQKIAALEKRLEETSKFQTDYTTSQQTQRVQAVQNEILTFANATDTQGKPLHPYFKDVEEDMGILAQACKAQGKPVVLQELYDRAIWANTSTRERLLKGQQTTAPGRTTPEARAKAVASKRAGSSVQGSVGSAQIRGNGEAKSVREALEAAWEESQAS